MPLRLLQVLLGCTDYDKGIDIWSVGCVIGEMLLKRTLFPGKSSLDQVLLTARAARCCCCSCCYCRCC